MWRYSFKRYFIGYKNKYHIENQSETNVSGKYWHVWSTTCFVFSTYGNREQRLIETFASFKETKCLLVCTQVLLPTFSAVSAQHEPKRILFMCHMTIFNFNHRLWRRDETWRPQEALNLIRKESQTNWVWQKAPALAKRAQTNLTIKKTQTRSMTEQ